MRTGWIGVFQVLKCNLKINYAVIPITALWTIMHVAKYCMLQCQLSFPRNFLEIFQQIVNILWFPCPFSTSGLRCWQQSNQRNVDLSLMEGSCKKNISVYPILSRQSLTNLFTKHFWSEGCVLRSWPFTAWAGENSLPVGGCAKCQDKKNAP